MATRFAAHLLEGDHASRPAASAVPEGTLYSCSDHGLIYQSDTSAWATWATMGDDISAHTGDTTDAHDASAISIADAGNDFTATDVEGALAELQADAEAHLADGAGAHAASAISFTPAGSIAATDVQAAIEEVASEAGGGYDGTLIEYTLGADVDMPSANTAYDGPSGTPAAGTYDVIGILTVATAVNSQIHVFCGRLVNGSTVVDERDVTVYVGNDNGYPVEIVLRARVTVSGSDTLKLVALSNRAGCDIKRNPIVNGSGVNRASLLSLTKV
jgi:hypothetical protein